MYKMHWILGVFRYNGLLSYCLSLSIQSCSDSILFPPIQTHCTRGNAGNHGDKKKRSHRHWRVNTKFGSEYITPALCTLAPIARVSL
ncbi:hypothetical protein BJX61DRAFT_153463 [Aspergillus egyptiacus]|nr:hypothetical protein BJX61DRAFT_153463 [Aspergillus egyptiacus]